MTSTGLQNPEEHDVYFDFNKEAIDSFLKIPGNQEIEEKRRLAKEDERFAGHQNRGELWVLRVRYSRENVRSTGLKQAMDMATPAQKATLMDLAQLREVGEFTFHTKANSAHRKMLKRWERYMEKVTKEAENVSVPAPACMSTPLTNDSVCYNECLYGRHPPSSIRSAYSHKLCQYGTLSNATTTKGVWGPWHQ